MSNVSKSTYFLKIEHVSISTPKSFADTAAALEAHVPHVDDSIWERLLNGDVDGVRKQLEDGPPLLIFEKRDHGSTDQMIDHARNCYQYEIGNPLTASKMTSKVLAAGLYAPLRVILYENDKGGSTFEYDRPSGQFGQFADGSVAAVGAELDVEIDKALTKAAS